MTRSDFDLFLKTFENEIKSSLTIHEPLPEEIYNENDKWRCYDFQDQGLIIEVVSNIVAAISFSSGKPTFEGSKPIPRYARQLPNDMHFDLSRDDLRKIYGEPRTESELFDQYLVNQDILLGVLFSETTEEISFISFGVKSIFLNPEKRPNRFSLIFESLS